MEETLYFVGATALNALIAYVLGWLFVEFRRPVFNFKPFNCRPCFTFWASMFISIAVYRLVLGLPWHGATFLALLPSFALFLHLKSKFKIYE